eukprot:jgi/Ulvmu1/12880/UM098_0068.1
MLASMNNMGARAISHRSTYCESPRCILDVRCSGHGQRAAWYPCSSNSVEEHMPLHMHKRRLRKVQFMALRQHIDAAHLIAGSVILALLQVHCGTARDIRSP